MLLSCKSGIFLFAPLGLIHENHLAAAAAAAAAAATVLSRCANPLNLNNGANLFIFSCMLMTLSFFNYPSTMPI